MKTLSIILISLLFLFSANAYAGSSHNSCSVNPGGQFEPQIDSNASSGHHEDIIKKHHDGMDKEQLMKKMEKNRDAIEHDYHSDGHSSFDSY